MRHPLLITLALSLATPLAAEVGGASLVNASYGTTTQTSGGTLSLNNGGSLFNYGANYGIGIDGTPTLTIASATIVSLHVTGVINGPLTLSPTLKGTATFTGAVTIQGTHAPGNSPAITTFAAGVTYGTNSTLEYELIGDTLIARGGDFDGIDVTGGNLSISSGATLKLIDLGTPINYASTVWDSARTFTVVDVSGGGSTSGNFALDTSLAGSFGAEGSWSLLTAQGFNGDTVLSWTPVGDDPAEHTTTSPALTFSLVYDPAGDHDSDGISNLLELAFGTDLYQAGAPRLPQPVLLEVAGAQHAGLTYTRSKTASGITFTVEFSSTPAHSGFAPAPITETSRVDNGDGTETVTLRETAPSVGTRFARLRVIQN